MNPLILKAVVGVVAIFLLSGCDLSGDLIRDHKETCRAHGKILVHDRALWREYVDGASQSYLNRKNDFPDTEMSIPEYVDGFEFKFGKNLEDTRKISSRKIVRNDIYILKEKKIVVQFVDYFASYGTMGGKTNFDCAGLYPELYKFDLALDYAGIEEPL